MYVDDIPIASSSIDEIQRVKDALQAKWSWTDSGEAEYILGLTIKRDRQHRLVHLSQQAYINQIIKRFDLENANSVRTPLEPGNILTAEVQPSDERMQTLYRAMVGSVMWVATATRPDIAYASSTLGKFNANPGNMHLQAAKRVLRYLKGTAETSLTLGALSDDVLVGWSDADYAGDLDTRRSTSGNVFKLYVSTIAWQSVRQSSVALSTCESEYMALTEATKEAIALRRQLAEMGLLDLTHAIPLLGDNQVSLALASNPGHHRRTKHIDVRYHFIRDAVTSNIIDLRYIPTIEQTADILTKGLTGVLHWLHWERLGLRSGTVRNRFGSKGDSCRKKEME